MVFTLQRYGTWKYLPNSLQYSEYITKFVPHKEYLSVRGSAQDLLQNIILNYRPQSIKYGLRT